VLSEQNIQRYVRALYPVTLLLILVPLCDLALRGFPPQFGSLQWRFGIVGVLFGNFGTILLGLGLTGLIAALAGHRMTLRILGYVAMILGAITIAALALFVLDAVQMRQLVNANVKRTVLLGSIGAMFAALLGAVALFSIARGALAASAGSSAASRRARPAAAPLVVAGQSAGDTV